MSSPGRRGPAPPRTGPNVDKVTPTSDNTRVAEQADARHPTAGAPFQVMPPLSPDERKTLLDDIGKRGVIVPVVVDQHGRVLDGHHRQAIATKLGIDCPVEVREVADDEDARKIALALNLARRHLTQDQRRVLIAKEIKASPKDSDRAIARRLGCSPTTVGAVRVSTVDRAERRAKADRTVEDRIAEAVGMSTEDYLMARTVVAMADEGVLPPDHGLPGRRLTATEREVARECLTEMDATGDVGTAYQRALAATLLRCPLDQQVARWLDAGTPSAQIHAELAGAVDRTETELRGHPGLPWLRSVVDLVLDRLDKVADR